MKRFALLLLIGILLSLPFGDTYAQKNMFLVSHLTYNQGANDIWGYVDSRTEIEYAIVGLDHDISIVSLANPANPKEVARIPDSNSLWHDMKVWNNHIYVTNESSQGLLIIDVNQLPEVNYVRWNGSQDPNFAINMHTAHNLFIDEHGFAYIFGADVGVGGAIILDLNQDPLNPPIVGIYDTRYIHDGYVRDNIMWSAEINDGILSVVDVSDKANPQVLATTSTPNDFTHNCWLSDDGNTIYTTDERANAFIAAYDVSDLSDIRELDRVQSSAGQNVIPHNTFVKGDFLVTSYYRDGVTVHDATNPNFLVEIGNYDTSPDYTGDGFNGCWGVYPYLPSGLVIASDIEEGLYVIQPSYIRACYIQGNITDAATNENIAGVKVRIEEVGKTFETDFSGNYANGIPDAGFYTVTFSKLGYQSVSYSNIFLANGETLSLSANLIPAKMFKLTGRVRDSETSDIVVDAKVVFSVDDFSVETSTDETGLFTIPDFLEGSYEVFIGKWGYQNYSSATAISESNTTNLYDLNRGYADDFAVNLGWTVESTASAGIWERGVPYGTNTNGLTMNPDRDVEGDTGNQCYVTGNAASSNVAADDVDAGYTRLISPVFDLSTYEEPEISYYRWFANAGGQVAPNDELIVTLSNGTKTQTVVERVDANNPFLNQWYQTKIKVRDFIEPTATMQITFETADEDGLQNGGGLVEAGVDVFSVTDLATVGIEGSIEGNTLSVLAYPNPSKDGFNISLNGVSLGILQQQNARLRVFSIRGREVFNESIEDTKMYVPRNNLKAGIYIYVVEVNGDWTSRGELLIQD
ncbi:MAG: choice-of-anchor B family protein [Chitinophagales bacterium]